MPAAVPLIAVVASGVASAAVGGGVLGALVGAGAALVVTAVGGAIFPARKPSVPTTPATTGFDASAPGAGRTQSVRQPITEHQIVFGRCKVSGPIVFLHSAPDDQGREDGYFSPWWCWPGTACGPSARSGSAISPRPMPPSPGWCASTTTSARPTRRPMPT
ncbi:hypothetical protein [Caldovatus sediminis]|uniref:hypothetical protein n=1 Tax=Caldovatus sediminis TaxID=2041189 RepID=UPI001E4308F2|nr:hypothetical protein [Caldovatus sediminis]